MRLRIPLISAIIFCGVFCMAEDSRSTGALTVHLQIAPTPESPRNSEGAFVSLKDGRTLFVYSHFTGGKGDDAAADLVGRTSSDGGKTWSEPAQLVAREGRMNVMSVSL